MALWNGLLIATACLALVPALYLFVQCAIGSWSVRRMMRSPSKARPEPEPGPVAVVIPAHNEETEIGPTVTALIAELRETDRIVVVAHNCLDDTGPVARQGFAEQMASVVHRDKEKIFAGGGVDGGIEGGPTGAGDGAWWQAVILIGAVGVFHLPEMVASDIAVEVWVF